jgi:hypothetical protein
MIGRAPRARESRSARAARERRRGRPCDPDAVDGLIDEFLQDPAFPERVVDLWAGSPDVLRADDDQRRRAQSPTAGFQEAAGEEALRILARVADDLPWTDIVTADFG